MDDQVTGAFMGWCIQSIPFQWHHIDGLVQERCNSSALAMELHLSCINPSTWALLHLISLATCLLVQQLVQAKKSPKALQHWKVDFSWKGPVMLWCHYAHQQIWFQPVRHVRSCYLSGFYPHVPAWLMWADAGTTAIYDIRQSISASLIIWYDPM